jgi:outer membrane biosynthesis protein TonB
MALVLVLDAILAGAGVVMLLSYLEARQGGRAPNRASAGAVEPGSQVSTPEAARPEGANPEPPPAPAPEPESASPPEPQPKPSQARPPEEAKPRAKPARPETSKPGARSDSSSGAEPTDGELLGMAPGWERDPDQALQPAAAVHPPEADVEELTGALRRVVDRHQRELEDCHAAASNSAGPDRLLEGRIDIRFTLMPGGRSADVRPVANTTGSAALAECVVAGVRSWSFPATAAAPLELEWPFLFRPAAHAKR